MTDVHDVPVALGRRLLHPRRGLHAPRLGPPPRRPRSVRRTITIDTFRPGDIRGDAWQIAVGRDVLTSADGRATVIADRTVRTVLDYPDHYRLKSIDTEPSAPSIVQLVGVSVSTGFRAAMRALLPVEHERATLFHAVLDDLPGAALVSGYAVGRVGAHPERKLGSPVLQVEGLCAGFQRGGTIMLGLDETGQSPTPTGPEAPDLLDHADPLAWHELRAMGAHDMRRWRCLDVVAPDDPGAPLVVEAYFRDSHMDEDGRETVIHEYTVDARVEPLTGQIVEGRATAHSLPWLECIEAEASGLRIAGESLLGLRDRVREGFVGVTTCTHLNDTIRSIEDVRGLLSMPL